ncbi:MAG: aminoacetone oxidase family FAD-binding enzyme [Elusimicrobiaceae bacterium]|nr:aminoacetone oxidase family FAD-binding enzyme [Elusimicrobiaceae bacterium]
MSNITLPNTIFHTAIVGAGASGLFCAGSFSAPKIVLEANQSPARKVAVSGGGKCNFSNQLVSAAHYDSQNKHFCKNALAAFKPTDFTDLLDQAHIPWEERTHGRLFAKKADDIVRFLLQRAKKLHTTLGTGIQVLDIRKKQDLFTLSTSAGVIQARNVVLATGGLSFPSLGASPFGWQLARRLGLNIVEPRPALCGLTWPKELRDRFASLAGSSLPVIIRQGKHSFEDALLFTHEGISGPAVLQLSLFWQPDIPVEINFLPNQSVADIFQQHKNSSKTFVGVMNNFLPGKIARTLLAGCDAPLSNATRAQLQQAAHVLNHFQFTPASTSGYTKAEVTAGGIDTRELVPATLECRRIPGLFIIGELVDVTGNLGGFNLHWAWASAWLAAQALKKRD